LQSARLVAALAELGSLDGGVQMLLVKIITTFLVVSLTPFVVIRDWRFSDRRTTKHHWVTKVILVCWVVGCIGSIVLVWKETSSTANLETKIDDLVTGKNRLLRNIADYQNQIQVKDAQIATLKEDVQKAGRGVTASFDFNGARRSSSRAGYINVSDGPEVKVFAKMNDLQKNQDWAGLLEICEKQVKETSDWLTLYIFRGVAHANLGQLNLARSDFEHVVKESNGDPDYKEATSLLERINAK